MAQTSLEELEFELELKWQYPEGKGTMSDGTYERNTKAIDPNTRLHDYVMRLREALIVHCGKDKLREARPPQIELITLRDNGNEEMLQRRADRLHTMSVYVDEFGYVGNSFSILLDPAKVESYDKLNIVLVTFRDRKDRPKMEHLRTMCLEIMSTFMKEATPIPR